MRRGSPSRRPRAPITPEVTGGKAAGSGNRARYFGAVHRAALAALEQGQEQRRFLRLGGEGVCLRFPCRALADALMPALAHLTVPAGGSCSLSVCVWDSRSTGVRVPRPPWKPEDYIARGDIRGWASDVRAAYNLGAGALSLFDPERGAAVFWVNDVGSLPTYERSAPLRTILGWFLRIRGRELLHAGAVGQRSGGVLLAGRGGRGKSTVALSCVGSGGKPLLYAGDDYVAVEPSPVPWVHSVYNSGKLDLAHARQRLPELIPLLSNPGVDPHEKGLLFVHQHLPERIVTGFPLRAVVLPEVCAERSRGRPALRAVSPLAVLQELAPTTMSQMPGTDQGTFRALASLVRAVPCYRLAIGPDLADAREQICTVLGEAS
jgi:hypothetical protein